MPPIVRFSWLITLFCSLAAACVLLYGIGGGGLALFATATTSAALVIIPYVISRSIEGLTKK